MQPKGLWFKRHLATRTSIAHFGWIIEVFPPSPPDLQELLRLRDYSEGLFRAIQKFLEGRVKKGALLEIDIPSQRTLEKESLKPHGIRNWG